MMLLGLLQIAAFAKLWFPADARPHLISLSSGSLDCASFLQKKNINVHEEHGLSFAEAIPPLSIPDEKTPIHVTVAAFQDTKRCARTLAWALEKAEHPARVHFTVMQARAADAEGCVEHFKREYLQKGHCEGCDVSVLATIKEFRIGLDDAMGPAHTRGLLNEKLEFKQPDEMCLSLDSHMNFKQSWDELLLKDWSATNNEFAVLTAYVADMSVMEDSYYVDHCGWTIEDGIPRGQTGSNLPRVSDLKPAPTMTWAAGFSFHRCHAERNVPVDASLKWIFTGEEFDRAVRLWSHGYDLYNPTGLYVTHDYSYSHPTQEFWKYTGPPGSQEQFHELSRKRLKTLMQIDSTPWDAENDDGTLSEDDTKAASELLGTYGLGNQRSLAQYVEWSRFDLGGRWTRFLKQHGGATERKAGDCRHELERVAVEDPTSLTASANTI